MDPARLIRKTVEANKMMLSEKHIHRHIYNYTQNTPK
jgi:hypothetical protein